MGGLRRTGIALCVIGTLVAAPAVEARGQDDVPDTYGASETSYTVGAYDFTPFFPSVGFSGFPGTGDRYFTQAGGTFVGPVRVPNGALLTRLELQGCDTSTSGALTAQLLSNTTINGVQSEVLHGTSETSTTGAPGCGFYSADLTPNPVVVNQTRTYYVQVTMTQFDSTVRFSAVRVYYRLQVSPAPATATFPNDVPTTHPFFRFVEALAASGVTGGCAPASYCPDAPVTRGQMAIFLSVALGLHFPN